MGRGKHQNWTGFLEIKNDKNVIVGAKCMSCEKLFVKRDAITLGNHKLSCQGKDNHRQEMLNTYDNAAINAVADKKVLLAAGTKSEINADVSMSSSQSSIGEQLMPNRVTDEEKNLLLLKFFLACGIDIERISSVHCTSFIRSLDTDYNLPSLQHLQDGIQKLVEKNRLIPDSQTLSNIMCVQTHESVDEFFAISLLLNCDKKYIYINSVVLKKDKEIINNFESFCNRSVQKVFELYKKSVQILIYNGEYCLDKKCTINNVTCFRLHCLSVMIDHLRHKHGTFDVASLNCTTEMTNYYKSIEELEFAFSSPECSLDEAVEKTFQFVVNYGNLPNISSIIRIVLKFITGPALACNYLNHKLYGHYFEGKSSLTTIMMQFIEAALPHNAYLAFADYKNQSGAFQWFSENDKIRFWSNAVLANKPLSEFALTLFTLPPIMPKISMARMIDLRSKLFDEKDTSAKDLLFSLIIEESNHRT